MNRSILQCQYQPGSLQGQSGVEYESYLGKVLKYIYLGI